MGKIHNPPPPPPLFLFFEMTNNSLLDQQEFPAASFGGQPFSVILVACVTQLVLWLAAVLVLWRRFFGPEIADRLGHEMIRVLEDVFGHQRADNPRFQLPLLPEPPYAVRVEQQVPQMTVVVTLGDDQWVAMPLEQEDRVPVAIVFEETEWAQLMSEVFEDLSSRIALREYAELTRQDEVFFLRNGFDNGTEIIPFIPNHENE